MSSISKARSIECGEILTPDQAEAYFQAGVIFNKRKFICIGTGCGCFITCVNMDKPKSKRKVDPYFRTVEEHSDSCNIYDTNYQNTVDRGEIAHVPEEQSKNENEPENFFLARPKSHLIETRAIPNSNGVETVTVVRGEVSGNIQHYSASNIYHVGSLVTRYHKYSKQRRKRSPDPT